MLFWKAWLSMFLSIPTGSSFTKALLCLQLPSSQQTKLAGAAREGDGAGGARFPE